MPGPKDKNKNRLSNSPRIVPAVPSVTTEPDSPTSTLLALHEQSYVFFRTVWYFIPPIMLITTVFIISFLYYYQNFDMVGLAVVPALLSNRRERLFPIRQRASEAIAHCPVPPREMEALLALRQQSSATNSITTAATTSQSSTSKSIKNKAIPKEVSSQIWPQILMEATKQLDEFYNIAKDIKELELLAKIVRKNFITLSNDIHSSKHKSSADNRDKMAQELDELSKFILVFKPIIHELKELQSIADTVRAPISDESLVLKFLFEYTRLSNQNYPLRMPETSVAGSPNIVDVLKKVKWRLINNIIQSEKMIMSYIDHIDNASISRKLFNQLIRYNDHFYAIMFDDQKLSADKLSHILNDHLLFEKMEKKYFIDFFKKILFYQYKNKIYNKNFEIAYRFMDSYYMQISENEREEYIDFFKRDLHSWSSWRIIKKQIESFLKIDEAFNNLLHQMIIDNIPSYQASDSEVIHYKFSEDQTEQFIMHIILQLAEMSLPEFKSHPLILGYLHCPHLWGALSDFLGAVTITDLELDSRAPKPISKNIAMAKLAVIIASQVEKDINNFSDERIHAIFDKGLSLGPTTKIVVFLEREPQVHLRFILSLRRIFNTMAKLLYKKDHWQVESFASISYHAIKAVHRKMSFIQFKQLIQLAYQAPEVVKGMGVDKWLIQRIEEINGEQAENEIFTSFNAKIAGGGLFLGSLFYLLLKIMSARAVPVRAMAAETSTVVVSAERQDNDASKAKPSKHGRKSYSRSERFQSASSSRTATSLGDAQASSSSKSNSSTQVKDKHSWKYLRENLQRCEIMLNGKTINISLDAILVFVSQDFSKNKQAILAKIPKLKELTEFERITNEAKQIIEKLVALGRMDSKQLQEMNETLMAPQALIDLCKCISNLHAQNVHDKVQRQLKYLFEFINQFHAHKIQSDGENEFDNVASSNNGNQGEDKLALAVGYSTVVACSSASSTDPLNGEDGLCLASCSQGGEITEEQARAKVIEIGKKIITLLKPDIIDAELIKTMKNEIHQLKTLRENYWPGSLTYIALRTSLKNSIDSEAYRNCKSMDSLSKFLAHWSNSLTENEMNVLRQFINHIRSLPVTIYSFWSPIENDSEFSSRAMTSPNPWL